MGKRALTTAVAAATMLWSAGVSSFVAPLTARAATPGELIKGTTLSTLYYYGMDGKRYTFPNEKTYFTWYSDFSSVKTVSDSELSMIPLGGNVMYRPGSRWVKIQTDNKTYAVTPQGQLRWIETEAVAQGLCGSSWNTMIDDVPDVYFPDYQVGASLTSAANGYNGMLVSNSGNTYLIWNNAKRMVSSSAFAANRFQTRFVCSGSGVNLSGMTAGTDVMGMESVLTDTAQMGGSVTGGLSVSLASDTPASATIPAGAASVPFTKLKLMANSGSVTVNQLVLTLGGVGGVDNLDDVYLYDGYNRLTDGRSVNSNTRKVTFSGLNLMLNSGDMKYLTVRADVSDATDNGGDTANFTLVSASDVASSATVSGNFPISGNTMSYSATPAGEVMITETGSISNPTIGQKEAVIARFQAEANNEDAWLKQITLNVDDAADHTNYKLWNGSTMVSTGMAHGDLVSFTLTNPLKIEDGDNEKLTLSADIGGQADDKIKVAVEEKADVFAVGGDFGFNLGVDILDYNDTGSQCTDTGAGTECSYTEIQGGDLTFAFNGPTSDDIQIDGKDQVLMKFTITAEQMAEIKEFDVIVEGTDLIGAEANLQDITIRRANGTVWMGPEELNELGSDTVQTLTFTDDQTLSAGQSVDLMITADVYNGAVDGEVYNVTIDMDSIVAEDMNGDGLTDIVPGSDLVGNDMTLSASSMTVSVSTPPSDGSYVKGAQAVSVAGYSFKAGNTSDVKVTDVTFTATGDLNGIPGTVSDNNITVRDNVNSCSLFDSQTGALVDGPESVETTSQVLFENFNWTVKAGETQKLVLKCNFANVDPAGGSDDYAFFIADNDDVTSEDKDGDDVTETLTAAAFGSLPSTLPVITITGTGTLDVTLDGSTPKSTIVLGASTGIVVAKYKFDANTEPFTVQKLTLRNCNAYDEDGNCTDGAETTDPAQDNIAAVLKLSYMDQSGATKTAQGFLSNGLATFEDLSFYVPTDSTRVLTVMIDTNSVSNTTATSGTPIQLNFEATDGVTDVVFKAVGASSGDSLDESDLDYGIAANKMVVRKTKPTINLASGSPSGASIPGLGEVLRFNVAADSRGFVTLNQVTFKVTSSATTTGWEQCDGGSDIGAASKWEVYDMSDSSEKLDDDADWSFVESDGSACEATDKLAFAVLSFDGGATPAEEIGAGETRTYIVRVDTTGASSSSDDSIRIDIPDQSEVDALATPLDAIQWEDDNEDTTDIDGTYIKNLPVTGGTLVY